EWFEEAQKYLARFDLGAEWDGLVQALTRFEAGRGFVKTSKPLKSKDRPPQVALWIQNACLRDLTPLGDRDAFICSWWSWWRGLQPTCRDLEAGDESVGPESRISGGDWTQLNKSGQNGVYSVVASLAWWGNVFSG
ncbi:hypothetical protein ARMSODRAFT_869273, partial [Armillaria solidipes]